MARNGISWAGLALGAAAVAFNTQVGYSLVSANCAEATRLVVFTAMIASGTGPSLAACFRLRRGLREAPLASTKHPSAPLRVE